MCLGGHRDGACVHVCGGRVCVLGWGSWEASLASWCGVRFTLSESESAAQLGTHLRKMAEHVECICGSFELVLNK